MTVMGEAHQELVEVYRTRARDLLCSMNAAVSNAEAARIKEFVTWLRERAAWHEQAFKLEQANDIRS